MALRLGGWIKAIKFFIEEIIACNRNRQKASLKEYFEACLELVGSFTDNWFYLCRIGALKWSSAKQEMFVNRCSTVPTIIIYTM